MKQVRKIIEIDETLCDGCGQCAPACAEGAIQIIDGKARVIADRLCDGLGACLGECPTDALKIVEREAEEFDEEAVEEHLKTMTKKGNEPSQTIGCGCPSSSLQTFIADRPSGESEAAVPSALTHWPIKIRLVPPKAPFLKGADLLVLADCTAVAYTKLHHDLLDGKVVMMGCPKFDDAEGYVHKFTEVFQTADVKSVTVAAMEVPCCSGLPWIVKKGLEKSGKNIPLTEIVIGARGNILSRSSA
jgi:NAD-dependent dihydropyrimidine dehydrogenase PreA subunit